jgi:Uma2 family endonuclease
VSAVEKLATYQDLIGLAEEVRAEVLSGQVVALPAPRPRHSNVQRSLGTFVGRPFHDDDGFGGPGGWWIFVEVDVALGPHDIVRPDLAGWRRPRLPKPDIRPIELAPDWICEVVSPSNARHDLVVKRRLYARHGVQHYWIADPDARTLTALSLRGEQWLEVGVFADDETVRIPPFEAVELPIGRLFLPPDAAPSPG